MSISILATKLFVPPQRPTVIARHHLMQRLQSAVHGKLTLVSAPAGFGKTTLVSEWLTSSGYPHAWLSLDAADRDPTRFLTYLIAALQTINSDIGSSLLERLESHQSLSPEITVTALINEMISVMDTPFMLVLDDYHILDAPEIDRIIEFLLDHQPPQLHLVMTTREDPPFSLARLRARGQLTEIRIADLRFTLEETAEFLNHSMGLNLSVDNIQSLEARTEGWIAGLQMAAISLQGRQDTATFIQSFTGSHRFILDYLVEEVLQSQPEHIREFLFQTSILDRLNAELCAQITGRDDTQDILETLERSNMLIFPLDDERQWYRYHHLFADVLLAHASQHMPDQVPIWQRLASEWYEAHDFKSEAIHYAFAAGDDMRAADLLEIGWPAIFNGFKPATWRGWVAELPHEIVCMRPVLSAGYAWTLLDDGLVDTVESHLDDAERWLSEDVDSQPIIVNQAQFLSLPATIMAGRAYLSQVRGEAHQTIQHAQRALELLPAHDHYNRGITALFLGIGYWTAGNLPAAYQTVVESLASLKSANHMYFQIFSMVIMADIQMAQGRLKQAQSTYHQTLETARSQMHDINSKISNTQDQVIPGNINLYVGLSELYRQWGDLTTAVDYVNTGFILSEQTAFTGSMYRLFITMARIQVGLGKFDEALALLDEAEKAFQPGALLDTQPIAAVKTRVLLLKGQLNHAVQWVQEQGLSADDDLSYQREFEYFTLARVLIAQYTTTQNKQAIQDGVKLLDRTLQLAQTEGRTGSIIEARILQAISHHVQGDDTTAVQTLHQAMSLAETEGYVQVFADEGESMRHLLSICLSQGIKPDYVRTLLQAINQHIADETIEVDPNQLLIEPLSNRELDVLQLLANGYTNQAIADELVIALSTVKKHVNNIFGKLNVANRTQAVHRARELNLV